MHGSSSVSRGSLPSPDVHRGARGHWRAPL